MSNISCLPGNVFCIPRGDYMMFIITVVDEVGDLVDITSFIEIEYIVAASQGGTIELTKKLTLGDVTIDGTGSAFTFELTEAESKALSANILYHECRLTNASNEGQTVIAGTFRSPDTMLGTD